MKQEPVAWLSERLNDGSKKLSFYEPPNTDCNPDYKVEPLYTSPQSDEIEKLEKANKYLRENDAFLRKEFQDQNSRLKNYMERIVELESSPQYRELQQEIEDLKHDNEELLKSLTAERNQYRELSDDEIIDLCVKELENLIAPVEPDYDPWQWNDTIQRAILKVQSVKAILERAKK